MNKLPEGFGYLHDPRLIYDIIYAGSKNFVGRPIAGYHKPVCIASNKVIEAIKKVQDDLDALKSGYVLKIFDSYRPQTAVDDFAAWSKDPKDLKMQQSHYPALSKPQLFEKGYILQRSKHSTGSAIDLTLTIMGKELDMGTIFDFFDEKSHTLSTDIPVDAMLNRQILKLAMEKNGFKNYAYEWWHFDIIDEPFPGTYFDFPIA